MTRRYADRFRLQPRDLSILALIFSLACEGPTEPGTPQRIRVQPAWVTGEAAAAVDPVSRQFRFPDRHEYVSLVSAESLAVAVARFYAQFGVDGSGPSWIAKDRGGPVHFNALQVCGRAVYSLSPFGSFPPAVPGWARRGLGPQWAIALCADGTNAELSVGVPDNPMDVRLENGRIIFRQFGGGSDFTATGVPIRYASGLPLTAEEAVATIFQATGRLVNRVPVAFNGFHAFPLCSSWKIEIDQPVRVKSESGAITETREFFMQHVPACFSSETGFFIAAAQQPSADWVLFPKDTTGTSRDMTLDSAQVSLTGPVKFERVTIE